MNTEILATIGPATMNKVQELYDTGLSGIRINSSHGSTEEYKKMIQASRLANPDGYILFDIQGPKIRLGDLPKPVSVRAQDNIILRTDMPQTPQAEDIKQGIPISYGELDRYVKPGHRLYIDDGYVGLRVNKVEPGKIYCTVLYGDKLRSRKGLNHPDTVVDYPYTMPYDVPKLEFARQHNVDFIADSFTRNDKDVKELRGRLEGTGIRIVSKIENPEGVKNFDDILKETDAIMIARGDLGVELEPWKLPELQKEMIEKCNRAGKPVVTATQMLESMIENPHPSRADVSDTANAIYDGTDVVMLSGETSIGKYPVECVDMMRKIAETVEQTERYRQFKRKFHTLKSLVR